MAVVDCTIDDLLSKLTEWIPLWQGDVVNNIGDTIAIPVEYSKLKGVLKYDTIGSIQTYDRDIINGVIDLGEQTMTYINTVHGCRIYRLAGVSSYTDNFLMLFGKLATNL